MKSFLKHLLPLFILLFSISSIAQDFNGGLKLPQDQKVIKGKLDNGLTYYIRQNAKPEKRVEFRLVVNAGSILEDDDQQGLAHFLEHMAFNGTEDFSKNDLISFLEKSGLNFGADLNAYTSFDQTVYMFQMPSDRQGLIDSAFIVLENWAHKLSLDHAEIDKERGVVHEEWRLGLGAQDRMMKQYLPIIFNDSRYADRLPIGKMSVIDSCSYEAVTRFYNDWYRPDLMAVIVVGDIDPEFAKDKIEKHFKKIKNPENARTRIEYEIPGNDQPLVAIATDKEATSTNVSIMRKLKKLPLITNDNYRLKVKFDLYIAMFNSRLFEVSQQPDSPFNYATSFYGGFVAKSLDAFSIYSNVKDGRITDALSAMSIENRRVKRFGYSQQELDIQKAELMSNLEKALEEIDKTESRNYVREYVANYLQGEAFPGLEYEVALTKNVLPTITVDEMNQFAYYFGKIEDLVIMVTAPDKEEVVIPSEEELLNALKAAQEATLSEYEEVALATSLINESLPGGKVINTTKHEDFGITTLELSNGVKVTLKPTTFKNDEIMMTSYGLGGTSLVSDEDIMSAKYASDIISNSGIGELDKVSLNKFLKGKNVSVSPRIDELTQGLTGKSVKKDLETLFQLTYLYSTQPRKDTTAFKTFHSKMTSQFQFMMSNPQAVFYDTLTKLASSNSPREVVIPTVEQINSISLERAYDFYKNSYSNANGFHFVFVGSFDVESITPLITKYLGSLPASSEANNWKDVEPKFPKGITEATINKGTEPKSSVAILMNDSFEWSGANVMQVKLLMKILNIRMRESMREDQGGVYGVRAYPQISKYPEEEVGVIVTWGCSPENVDQLSKTVFFEMDTLIMNGPKAENIEKAKETTIRDYETKFEENRYWLGKIKSSHYNDVELKNFEEIKKGIQSISSKDLQEMAKAIYSNDHFVKVVLMPEEGVENE